MTLQLEGFYGRTVFLPEDLRYYKDQELWVRPWTGPTSWAFGFTEAGVAMISGFTYLEYIVAEGDWVRERSPVLAVDTYKVSFELYCPVSGKVVYLNQSLDGEGVKVIDENPYDYVLFSLETKEDFDPRRVFMDAKTYLQALEERQANICGT
jgi:glycine cleavage system H lipoate-binding protein